MKRLDGKVAIITGARSSKDGREIARGYAKEGATLFLQDWPGNETELVELRSELLAHGGRVEAGAYNVNSTEGAAQLVADAQKAFGKIDILVNTTAAAGHAPFFQATEASFRRALDRGVTSYFLMCQAASKVMARTGSGKIINLTSIVGKLGSGGAVAWGADRGAVDSMTAAIAQGVGAYGINVVALARGATDTTPYTPEALAERIRRLPFGRVGREDDVVGPAIFLATDDARWITGTVVYCDGGYTTAAVTDEPDRPKEFPYRGH
jgi:NAD(P)-dependent dehydrogenase (short-subunit alcohol dehydrogenase family)